MQSAKKDREISDKEREPAYGHFEVRVLVSLRVVAPCPSVAAPGTESNGCNACPAFFNTEGRSLTATLTSSRHASQYAIVSLPFRISSFLIFYCRYWETHISFHWKLFASYCALFNNATIQTVRLATTLQLQTRLVIVAESDSLREKSVSRTLFLWNFAFLEHTALFLPPPLKTCNFSGGNWKCTSHGVFDRSIIMDFVITIEC